MAGKKWHGDRCKYNPDSIDYQRPSRKERRALARAKKKGGYTELEQFAIDEKKLLCKEMNIPFEWIADVVCKTSTNTGGFSFRECSKILYKEGLTQKEESNQYLCNLFTKAIKKLRENMDDSNLSSTEDIEPTVNRTSKAADTYIRYTER